MVMAFALAAVSFWAVYGREEGEGGRRESALSREST